MINVQAFLDTLPIMGKGMLGIFVVITAIMVIVKLLSRMFPYKADN